MDDEKPLVPSLSRDDDTPVERPMRKRRNALKEGEIFSPPEPVVVTKTIIAPVVPRTYKRYKLMADLLIYRGASETTMEAGLILSAQHYDIAGLIKQGALLEELP
jgi:hypothetical protein